MKEHLEALIVSWRDSAAGLRSEVERGVCVRQSEESKLSRIQVLETCASQLERVLKEEAPR